MKKRNYGVFVRVDSSTYTYVIKKSGEAYEVALEHASSLFCNPDDALPIECFETNNFRGLREYLLMINKRELHTAIMMYVDSLEKLHRGVKHLRSLRPILKKLTKTLEFSGFDMEILLDSIVDDGTILPPCFDIASSVQTTSTANITEEEALIKAKKFMPGKTVLERFESKKNYIFTLSDDEDDYSIGVDKQTGRVFDFSKN